ncbi:hypothetical protein CBR_g8005 [Chara braunii]|uniref:Uncharacterized protein n=1 Tax=Chara braunii TaxID=69332 RepID=A0A388KKY4_CHABU|nr:hypothetical protein CBR_g8005 [Chara braunii]|eukprot:GBG70706.1 hypothetical protein CBR_g8005 [Chara braunii]
MGQVVHESDKPVNGGDSAGTVLQQVRQVWDMLGTEGTGGRGHKRMGQVLKAIGQAGQEPADIPKTSTERTVWTFRQKGTVELTHNWGTESDEKFSGYHNGNSDPRGFGKMKGLAFIKDPDGYWIEILSAVNMGAIVAPPNHTLGHCTALVRASGSWELWNGGAMVQTITAIRDLTRNYPIELYQVIDPMDATCIRIVNILCIQMQYVPSVPTGAIANVHLTVMVNAPQSSWPATGMPSAVHASEVWLMLAVLAPAVTRLLT